MLLERDELIGALLELEQTARSEGGRIALVFGEAGIGKTSLIDAFLASVPAARVLRGGCEALFTPRPLGPLYDIAESIDGELGRALDAEAPRQVIFGSFLRELGQSPTICVFEDVHWADEATLDLLKFIGRRIDRTRSLLLATYRDDEIGARHPLRYVTGDLPPGVTQRLRVPPLSKAAVTELARAAGREGSGLFELTGGNAFYVTEMLYARARACPRASAMPCSPAHRVCPARRSICSSWSRSSQAEPNAGSPKRCSPHQRGRSSNVSSVAYCAWSKVASVSAMSWRARSSRIRCRRRDAAASIFAFSRRSVPGHGRISRDWSIMRTLPHRASMSCSMHRPPAAARPRSVRTASLQRTFARPSSMRAHCRPPSGVRCSPPAPMSAI